jgi:transcription elongation factor GreA
MKKKDNSLEKTTYITPKGFEKLESELTHLRTAKRLEIAKLLEETMGDSEDNEYILALDEQAFVEGRIRKLESLLCEIKVIEPHQNGNGVIEVGSTVVLREGDQSPETFTIVGAAETDPAKGLISNKSPLGKALLYRKIGDDVEIKAPVGVLRFRVLAVQ